jgi:hypothetical protein
MNQLRAARVKSSLKRTGLLIAAVLITCGAQAKAQQRLADIVRQYDLEWGIGKWVATTDEGDKVQMEYKWQLDKNLLIMHLKWPNFEYHGMIFYKVMQDQVVLIGVDNHGGNGKGTYELDGDKLILKYEHSTADWETHRMALAYSKVDEQTMKLEVYGMDEGGEIEDQPRSSHNYKRQSK